MAREPTDAPAQDNPKNVVQSLAKGFRVLEAFTAAEPALPLAQVARRAAMDNATAFRLLNTLVMLGYVERIPGTRNFRLTLKCLSGVRPLQSVEIACTASDRELILVRWLNALLAEADLRGMVFCDFEVRLLDGGLAGTARGEPWDLERHVPGVEVKGATLTELEVARGEDGIWHAQTVVDV